MLSTRFLSLSISALFCEAILPEYCRLSACQVSSNRVQSEKSWASNWTSIMSNGSAHSIDSKRILRWSDHCNDPLPPLSFSLLTFREIKMSRTLLMSSITIIPTILKTTSTVSDVLVVPVPMAPLLPSSLLTVSFQPQIPLVHSFPNGIQMPSRLVI